MAAHDLQPDFELVFGRIGKARPPGSSGRSRAGGRGRVLQAIARKPQVMVKITGFGTTRAVNGKGKTKLLLPHLDYIARNCELPVYDADGRDVRALAPPLGQAPRELLHSYGRAFAAESRLTVLNRPIRSAMQIPAVPFRGGPDAARCFWLPEIKSSRQSYF